MDIYDQLAEIETRCYTTAEAADVLHIGERSVRHAISDERLHAVKFKGAWLISFQALQDYVSGNSEAVFAEAGEDARAAVKAALQLDYGDWQLPTKRRAAR